MLYALWVAHSPPGLSAEQRAANRRASFENIKLGLEKMNGLNLRIFGYLLLSIFKMNKTIDNSLSQSVW
jgi:hypothetical protein